MRELGSAAGGCWRWFADPAQAERVASHLPVAAALRAPGLTVAQALVPVRNDLGAALEAAEAMLAEQRNRPSSILPEAGPLIARTGTTGRPAIGTNENGELTDAAEVVWNALVPDANRRLHDEFGITNPRLNFSDLVSRGGLLAVVHIDVNGMGAVVRDFMRETMRLAGSGSHSQGGELTKQLQDYRDFTDAIDASTKTAMKQAIRDLWPADPANPDLRPLVMAGDDVMLVIAAEKAVGFTQAFLRHFEAESGRRLSRLPLVRRSHLTACAGIVFCRKNYPFRQAYRFCEDLCHVAKEQLRRTASGVLFARVTSALTGDYAAWRERELSVGDDVLSMGAYTVGGGYPNLSHLLELKAAMAELPAGGFRTYLETLYHAPERAERQFHNWLRRVKSSPAHKEAWGRFSAALEALTQPAQTSRGNALPAWWTEGDTWRQTPLRDAMELLTVESKEEAS